MEWDAHSGEEILTRELSFNGLPTLSPNGKRIAVQKPGSPNVVEVWDVRSDKMTLTLEGRANSRIHSVAFSPDGKRILGCSSDLLFVWDIDSDSSVSSR